MFVKRVIEYSQLAANALPWVLAFEAARQATETVEVPQQNTWLLYLSVWAVTFVLFEGFRRLSGYMHARDEMINTRANYGLQDLEMELFIELYQLGGEHALKLIRHLARSKKQSVVMMARFYLAASREIFDFKDFVHFDDQFVSDMFHISSVWDIDPDTLVRYYWQRGLQVQPFQGWEQRHFIAWEATRAY